MKVFKLLSLLLLAIILFSDPLASLAAKKKKPSKKPNKKNCDAHGAYKSLMKEKKYGQFADFKWLLQISGLKKKVKEMAKGKVLLAPTNAAFHKYYLPLAPKKRSNVDSGSKNRQVHAAIAKKMLSKLIVDEKDISDKSLLKRCQRLLTTHNVKKPLKLVAKPVSAFPKLGGTMDFSAIYVGTGYNLLGGFPIPITGTGLDPGINHKSIVDLNSSIVTNKTPGNCKVSTVTTVYETSSSLQDGMNTSLKVSAKYGPAAFSGGQTYKYTTNSQKSTSSSYIVTRGQLYLGTYALNIGQSTLPLNSGFLSDVESAIQDVVDYGLDWADVLNNFIWQGYGTHYITSLDYGSVATLMTQMSTSSWSSLVSSKNINVIASGGATFPSGNVKVDGTASFDTTEGDQIKRQANSQTYVYAPGVAQLPLASDGTIKCTPWAKNVSPITQSSIYPLNYRISSLANLFLFNPGLFTSKVATYPHLTGPNVVAFGQQLQQYITTCQNAPGGCPVPSSSCPALMYQSQQGGCNSCVNLGDYDPGMGCNPNGTASCDGSRCNCRQDVGTPKRTYTGPSCSYAFIRFEITL